MKEKLKDGFKNGMIPFFVMVGTMVALIILFRLCRESNTVEFQQVMNIGGEETNPTYGQLAYMLISFIVSVVLTFVGSRIIRKNSEKTLLTWTLGVSAGTMMWQSIGESSWHFGLNVLTEEDELLFTNFPRIECMQGIPFFIMTAVLAMILIKRKALDFGFYSFFARFLGNWFGHIDMIGTYPFIYAVNPEASLEFWYKAVGGTVAVLFAIIGIYLIFFSKKEKQIKYLSSVFLFVSYGNLVYGVIFGET